MEYEVISSNVDTGMEKLTRLRNMTIHRYWEADDARIYMEAKERGLSIISLSSSFLVKILIYSYTGI